MPILIKNTTLIDSENFSLLKGNVVVENGLVTVVDSAPSGEYEILDGTNKFVTKSLVCGHHHAYSLLARGMPFKGTAPENFHQILQKVWWKLDKLLDEDMIRASAIGTGIACLKNGVTFVIDHHASPNHWKGSLHIIAEEFEKMGLSHLLCLELSDRDGEERLEQAYEENEAYLKSHQALVGLHASFTVSDAILKKASDLCQKYDAGIHVHVSEDQVDNKTSLEKYNNRPIDRLNHFGLLNFEKSILAHCLHIDDNERQIIAKSKAWIVVNTESNLNNGVGQFNSSGLNANKIMLGTDGMHSDMFRSTRAHFFQSQLSDKSSSLTCYQRLRAASNYLSTNNFKGDSADNLIILDYKSPTELNESNFLGHFFYGLTSYDIDSVISNGEVVLKNKQLTKINETESLQFCKEQGERLWQTL